MRVSSAFLSLLSCTSTSQNCTVDSISPLPPSSNTTRQPFNTNIAEDILKNLNAYLDTASTMNLGKVNKAFKDSTAAVNKLAHDKAFKEMQQACPTDQSLYVTNDVYSLLSPNVRLRFNETTKGEQYGGHTMMHLKTQLKCVNSLTSNLHHIKDRLEFLNVYLPIDTDFLSAAQKNVTGKLLRGIARLLSLKSIKRIKVLSYSSLSEEVYAMLQSSGVESLIIRAPLADPQHFEKFARQSNISKIDVNYASYFAYLPLFKNLKQASLPVSVYQTYPKKLLKLKSLTGVNLPLNQVSVYLAGRKVVDELTIYLLGTSTISVARSNVKLKALTLINANSAHSTFMEGVLLAWKRSLVTFDIHAFSADDAQWNSFLYKLLVGNSGIKTLSVSYDEKRFASSVNHGTTLMREMTFGYLEHAVSLESLSISMLLVDENQFLPLLAFVSTHHNLQRFSLNLVHSHLQNVSMQYFQILFERIVQAVEHNASINDLTFKGNIPCEGRANAQIFLSDFADATKVLVGRNLTINGVSVKKLVGLRDPIVSPYMLYVNGILGLRHLTSFY